MGHYNGKGVIDSLWPNGVCYNFCTIGDTLSNVKRWLFSEEADAILPGWSLRTPFS